MYSEYQSFYAVVNLSVPCRPIAKNKPTTHRTHRPVYEKSTCESCDGHNASDFSQKVIYLRSRGVLLSHSGSKAGKLSDQAHVDSQPELQAKVFTQ